MLGRKVLDDFVNLQLLLSTEFFFHFQRNIWNFEAAKRHISLTEELVKQCVPRVKVRKIIIRRPGLAQNMKGINKRGRKKTISTASSH